MVRQVHLIIGPPGAGKTTHAHTLELPVYDRDDYPTDTAYRAAVTAACQPVDAHAAVIRCCPTRTEQTQWEHLTQPTIVTVLDLNPDEAARRIYQRRRPTWRAEIAAARAWRTTRGPEPRRTSRKW